MSSVIVIGSGAFGITTAIELNKRGYLVTVIDRGLVPHPYASSTDTSKMVRFSHGQDLFYSQLMMACIPLWDEINEEFGELFHKSGVLYLVDDYPERGGFEFDSSMTLNRIGFPSSTLLSSDEIQDRYPLWNTEAYPYAYFHPDEGWVESGKVIEKLFEKALKMGVRFLSDEIESLVYDGHHVVGSLGKSGQVYSADTYVLAAGAWSPFIFPELKKCVQPTGQVVFHFKVDPDVCNETQFPPFSADITKTGYYGFTTHPENKTIKIGNHGEGYPLESINTTDIDKQLQLVIEEETKKFRQFLKESIPSLVNSPIDYARMCLYCDSFDHDWIIDYHPEYDNLVIATGGSGTAFKFTPILGRIVSNVLEKIPDRFSQRFAWREEPQGNNDQIRLRDPKL